MVIVRKVTNREEFIKFMERMNIQGSIFILKPSWPNTQEFTSATTLDWLFHEFKGMVKVIEAYNPWRNELTSGQELKSIMTPSNIKSRWRWIKNQDAQFLESSGIKDILSKYNAEYINVTEEYWSMRTLEPDEVRDCVDNKYGVLVNQEMYNFFPSKLYSLRGSNLISVNVSQYIQGELSLSTMNLFDLIPNPMRHTTWRGRTDSHLSQSIVDINKIYRSFFSPCYWINEIKKLSLFVGSRNSIEADSITAKLLGKDPQQISYLKHARNVFGGYTNNYSGKNHTY